MYNLGTWLQNRYAIADMLLLDDHNINVAMTGDSEVSANAEDWC
jgi:hypothetical protein